MVLLLCSTIILGQNKEIYAGVTLSNSKILTNGYNVGFNHMFTLNKTYSNEVTKIFIGVEHSGLTGKSTNYYNYSSQATITQCDICDSEVIDQDSNNEYKFSQDVRGVSLNIGLEILTNLYITSGVTHYQYITKLNKRTIRDYRETLIDAGFKYFIKSGKHYLVPTFKFNAETYNISLGFTF